MNIGGGSQVLTAGKDGPQPPNWRHLNKTNNLCKYKQKQEI